MAFKPETSPPVTRTAADMPDLGALSAWAPELAKTFVSLASDIALVIDGSGVIRNVAQGQAEPIAPGAQQWVGRAWIDTVSGETRPKIENLLKEVAATGIARRREVNHPLTPGVSIPVAYTAIRLGADGPVLAVGRDLRAIAAIQQRFIDNQQDMERGYWQARQAESRYRLLFQVATDAVMVVDAETLQIVEANQAAAQLFDITSEQLPGRPATFGFEHHSRGAVNALLTAARGNGQTGEIRARLLGTITATSVAATPFRADDTMRLLVRVRSVDGAASSTELNTTLARLVDDARDGVVVTDSSGRILVANPAFLALVNLAHETDVKGQMLMDWLGLADRPLVALVPQVRRDGIARRIESWVKPAHSPAARVEISAALLTEGDQECIGFTIHRVAGEVPRHGDLADALRAGVEQIAQQLGAMPLPEMLREATALAERHFMQVAMQRAGGDVSTAAGLLGIDRASLVRRQRNADGTGASGPDGAADDQDSA
ncbi:MAG: transcriptional regulator PpsR [Burkholderiaceae bacterium]